MKKEHAIFLLFILLLGAFPLLVLYQVNGFKFSQDTSNFLKTALDFVDHDQWPVHGSSIIYHFHLGPICSFFAALPLLFSRNIILQYVFIVLLSLLSIPVFFAGAKLLFPSGPFKYITTAHFTLLSIIGYLPVGPDHKHYVPIFLAVYFYYLIKALKINELYLLFAWLGVALCMQAHFACYLLAPTTLLATYLFQKDNRKKTIILTILGLLIVLLLHANIVIELFQIHQYQESFSSTKAPAITLVEYLYLYGRVFFFSITKLMLRFSIISPLLLLLSILELKKISAGSRLMRSVLFVCFFYLAATYFLSPLLGLLKLNLAEGRTGFEFDYYLPSILFWSVIAGIFFQWISSERNFFNQDKYKRIINSGFTILYIFTSLFTYQSFLSYHLTPNECKEYPDFMRLKEVSKIYQRVGELITDNNFTDINTAEYVYEYSGNAAILRSKGRGLQSAFILYQHPELHWRFSPAPDSYLIVVIASVDLDWPEAFLGSQEKVKLIDRFYAGCLPVSIYFGDPDEFKWKPLLYQ